jgi:hypothetical protein
MQSFGQTTKWEKLHTAVSNGINQRGPLGVNQEDQPTVSNKRFSDIWANAQRSHTALIPSNVLEVLQHVYDRTWNDHTATGTLSKAKE